MPRLKDRRRADDFKRLFKQSLCHPSSTSPPASIKHLFLWALLREERLPESWVGVVVDRQDIIVARTLAPESGVGQAVGPAASAVIAQGSRGAYSFITREGIPSSAYYIKLPATGWTVALSVPKQQLEGSARQSMQFMLGLGIAALSTATVLAFLVGRHMIGQTARVARAALALGEGQEPALGPTNVRELDEVSGALAAARGLIRSREAALRESEARLRSILEAANVIAWEADLGTDCVHAVGPAARLFDRPDGFRMETREAFLNSIATEDRDRVLAEFEAAAKACRPYSTEFRVSLSNGGERWICCEGAVELDGNNLPARMRGISFEVSKRKTSELALADALRVTAVACKAGNMGTWHRDVTTNRLTYSDELLTLIGIGRHQWGGTPDSLEPIMHPDDIEHRRQMRAKAEARGDVIDIDFRIRRPDGQLRWLQSRGRIHRHADGTPIESFGVMMDVTDRKRAEEHQRALVAELDHRVKNVLARVASVAHRTREGSRTLDDFVEAFDGRIEAMANTHSLLSRSRWTGASLTALVRGELEAYATPGNTTVEGPDIALKPDAAQAVTTVLHELATNAAKYGALSTATGHVSVRWETIMEQNPDPALVIHWVESGGPKVIEPGRQGYGTNAIREQIPYELFGKVDLTYASSGVCCRIEIPLSHVAHEDAA